MTDLIEELKKIATSEGADALLELTICSTREDLYDAALQAYGSWDGALAQALVDALQKKASTPRASAVVREEEVVRKRRTSAGDPVFAATVSGGLFWIDPDELTITNGPEIVPTPSGLGPIRQLWWVGNPDGVFVFSNTGRYYGLITRVLPQWMGDTPMRAFTNIASHANHDEYGALLLSRRAGRSGRYIHVTKHGKGKASEADELGATLDQTGREAFLLAEGDVPVAVMHGTEDSTVCCVSSAGQAIHFEAGDIRSMGRKAVGVNVMKLGPEDVIVNAFHGDEVEQIAMITASGLCKRVWFDEFRTQGRAGGGMQLCKLNRGDEVVGAVGCAPESDIVVTTSLGRLWRTEATSFALQGRPAKGNQVFDLIGDERIIGLSVLPTSTDNF